MYNNGGKYVYIINIYITCIVYYIHEHWCTYYIYIRFFERQLFDCPTGGEAPLKDDVQLLHVAIKTGNTLHYTAKGGHVLPALTFQYHWLKLKSEKKNTI